MVIGSLALLYFFLGGKQGSGPNKGQSPVEWADFPAVCQSICSSICLFSPLGHPARSEAKPARPEAQPAKPEAQLARYEAQPARPEAQPARPEAQPASQLSLRLQAWLDGPEGGTDGQMDKQKISPFYTTLFPNRAADPLKSKDKVE